MSLRRFLYAVLFAATALSGCAFADGPGPLDSALRQRFGGQIALAGASDGQVAKWNNTTKRWEPGTDSAASSAALDSTFGSTRGALLVRGAAGWAILAPGATPGHALVTNGAGADPSYAAVATAFPLRGPDGSYSAPSYSFTNETGLGLYRQGNGTTDFASGHTAGGHFRIHPTLSSPTAASTIQVYNRDNGSGTPLGGLVLYTLPPNYSSSGIFQANTGLVIADGNLSAGLVLGTSGGSSCPVYLANDATAYEKRLGTNIFMGSTVVLGWSATAPGAGLFGAVTNDTQFKRDAAGVIGVYAAGSNYGALALASSVTMRAGAGSPEAIVTANIGALYLRTDGASGTTLYTKASGNGLNTGWEAVGGSSLSGISNPAAGRLTWATGSGAVAHLTGPTDQSFSIDSGSGQILKLGGTLQYTGGSSSGTNISGPETIFYGGRGTGNAAGGRFSFRISNSVASGTTVHSAWTEKLGIEQTRAVFNRASIAMDCDAATSYSIGQTNLGATGSNGPSLTIYAGGGQIGDEATIPGGDGGNLILASGDKGTDTTSGNGVEGYVQVRTGVTKGLLVRDRPGTGGAFVELLEMTAPSSGGADTGRLFVRDNGAGKTQLCVIFSSGAIQVLATQP